MLIAVRLSPRYLGSARTALLSAIAVLAVAVGFGVFRTFRAKARVMSRWHLNTGVWQPAQSKWLWCAADASRSHIALWTTKLNGSEPVRAGVVSIPGFRVVAASDAQLFCIAPDKLVKVDMTSNRTHATQWTVKTATRGRPSAQEEKLTRFGILRYGFPTTKRALLEITSSLESPNYDAYLGIIPDTPGGAVTLSLVLHSREVIFGSVPSLHSDDAALARLLPGYPPLGIEFVFLKSGERLILDLEPWSVFDRSGEFLAGVWPTPTNSAKWRDLSLIRLTYSDEKHHVQTLQQYRTTKAPRVPIYWIDRNNVVFLDLGRTTLTFLNLRSTKKERIVALPKAVTSRPEDRRLPMRLLPVPPDGNPVVISPRDGAFRLDRVTGQWSHILTPKEINSICSRMPDITPH